MKSIAKKTMPSTQIVGEVEVGDPTTGEVFPVTLVRKNITKDTGFHKIWLQDILHILDSFGNKKVKVLTYLLNNMRNEDNSVTITQTKIAKDTGISRPTISSTLRELIDGDVLRRDPDIPNLYRFNPSMIIRGGADKRRALMTIYEFGDDNQSMTVDEEKNAIEQIAKKIENIGDSKIIDAEITQVETTETSHAAIERPERPSFIGSMNGKIGNLDARAVKQEKIEVKAEKTK